MATETKTKKKIRVLTIPIEDMTPVDFSKNVRDPSGSTYDLVGLKADILQVGGLTHRPLVHFRGGKFDHILQGFRRIASIGELHAELPHDDRWKQVEVEIVENLSDAEIMELMVDHGNTKSLEKSEIVRATWMTLDAQPGIGRDALATRMRGLLEIQWPAPKSKTGADEIAKHYTGTMQNIIAGWKLPNMAHATFMELVKSRNAVAYRKKDFAALVTIHEKEMAEDKSGTINKDHPGPVFLAKWEEFVASEEDKENGDKPRAIAAMSKSEQMDIHNNTNSRLVKFLIKLTTRTLPESDKKLLIFGTISVRDLEPLIPEKVWKTLELLAEGQYDKIGF